MWNRHAPVALTLAAFLWLAGCASKPMMQDQTLYQRLGGKPAITAVVDDFVANVAADTRINRRFAKTDIPDFKMKLVDQICAAPAAPAPTPAPT